MDELDPVFNRVAAYFALLAEPMRLKIMHTVCLDEKSISQIVEATGATQTNVSRHLNRMHAAGVLKRRKDGSQVYYQVADPTLTEMCRTACVAHRGGDRSAAANARRPAATAAEGDCPRAARSAACAMAERRAASGPAAARARIPFVGRGRQGRPAPRVPEAGDRAGDDHRCRGGDRSGPRRYRGRRAGRRRSPRS